jgi:hypothetical protein
MKRTLSLLNRNFLQSRIGFSTMPLMLVVVMLTLMWSCNKEKNTYVAYVPEYMDFDEFRASIKATPAKEMKQAGKIYFKDNIIFINEVNEGIHVIDNRNPVRPVKMVFYNIPGNVDMAIRGNTLFADSYIDLVAMDISDIMNPVEVGRMENAFPNVLPLREDSSIPMAWQEFDHTKGVVVGWKKKTYTQEDYPYNRWWWGRDIQFEAVMNDGGRNNAAGVAGSMARFMLHSHYLYSVAQSWVLKTIDVSDPAAMMPSDSIYTWREMETLYRLGDHLFVGTTSGMIIYDIKNPAKPEFVSDFNHANACDPVVVENNIAYVTLRTGNACQGFSNQLDVIDISNISNPKLLKSYPMFNPYGLGIDNGTLFICDGADGLKIYDARNPLAIQSNQIAHFKNIDTYDVIPLGDILVLIGQDGLFQYRYSDLQNIQLLSHIKLSN